MQPQSTMAELIPSIRMWTKNLRIRRVVWVPRQQIKYSKITRCTLSCLWRSWTLMSEGRCQTCESMDYITSRKVLTAVRRKVNLKLKAPSGHRFKEIIPQQWTMWRTSMTKLPYYSRARSQIKPVRPSLRRTTSSSIAPQIKISIERTKISKQWSKKIRILCHKCLLWSSPRHTLRS